MLAYAGHSVSLLWQSKHACLASVRVSGASQVGSPVTGGLGVLAGVRHQLDRQERPEDAETNPRPPLPN